MSNSLFPLKVTDSNAADDFEVFSNGVQFPDGVSSVDGTLILTNDDVPEGNETFTVKIVDARFGAEIGSLSELTLTVSASDDPHGKFQFDQVSLCVLKQPVKQETILLLKLDWPTWY